MSHPPGIRERVYGVSLRVAPLSLSDSNRYLFGVTVGVAFIFVVLFLLLDFELK